MAPPLALVRTHEVNERDDVVVAAEYDGILEHVLGAIAVETATGCHEGKKGLSVSEGGDDEEDIVGELRASVHAIGGRWGR